MGRFKGTQSLASGCLACEKTSKEMFRQQEQLLLPLRISLVAWGHQPRAGLRHKPGAWTETERQRKQQRTAQWCHLLLRIGGLTTGRARISLGVFASPPFQGKKQRAFRLSSARTPPGFSWTEDFCSKAFHKPWPRFSPWLACARCTTGTGEQRWLEATFCFSPLQAAGDWLPPRAGSPRLGLVQHQEMASKQPDLATPPSPWAAAAPAGAGRWLGWHQSPGTGSLRGASWCQCGHGWGAARCAARSGKQWARVSVCPRANAFIFSVPRGKATGGGHEKQKDFTKMIRCCFQIWFSAGDTNQ